MTEVERRRAEARRLAEAAGARIVAFGAGWRVVGPTIDAFVTDLAELHEGDFESPTVGWKKSRRAGAWTGRRPTTVGR